MEAGPIFRAVFPHSLALAILMGVLVMVCRVTGQGDDPGK